VQLILNKTVIRRFKGEESGGKKALGTEYFQCATCFWCMAIKW